jgi:hypothetical protein
LAFVFFVCKVGNMQFSSLSGGAASGGQDGRDVRKLSEMFTVI